MTKRLQAIRGMNDILPEATPYWRVLETTCADVASTYGYREVRFPIVEQTALFQRTIGEETDIVSKEMYTFEDRNGDSLTLRPEGTAGCVRMGIEHSLLHNQVQRFWYLGPMFRHERPQKGRYRQFHQFGVEAFGMAGVEIDAEMIAIGYRLWQQLGLQNSIHLEINSLGSVESRAEYRQELIQYITQHTNQLDSDSLRRLETNPLRILDSKNPEMRNLIMNAPVLIDYLDSESKIHFDQLQNYLNAFNISYKINPHLVRGLDYYGSTVFEWVTDALGAQGTVCAGGRYDVLVEQLGGKATSAIGFAMGLERMVLLLEQVRHCQSVPNFYCVADNKMHALVLIEDLRNKFPQLSVEVDLASGGVKSQFKRADKSGAKWALIIGEHELENKTVTIKNLRERSEQETISLDEFMKKLPDLIENMKKNKENIDELSND